MSRVDKWRKRAEEIRVVAEEMWDPEAKAMMLRMAQDWDNMAERHERTTVAFDNACGRRETNARAIR
jgi:hypothetical protein